MLTIKKITGVGAGAAAEYFTDIEEQRSRGDYYASPSGEAVSSPGRWLGRLSESLGLHGAVTLEHLLHVLDGRHPLTGKRLVPFRKDRVAAHDLTLSAPKSVSVIWALAPEALREAVDRAQAKSVEVTLEYIERTVPVVRRGDGGRIVETAAELLAVAFAHHTSRQTVIQARNDLPPDPQIHTHVLLAMARRHDGRLVAINSAALFDGRREIEAVYHNALATELAELGFEIERRTGRGRRYFEVKGVPTALCEEWSSRHTEIEKHRETRVEEFREQYGRDPNEVELRDLSIRSRMPKGRHYHRPAEFWQALGAAYGVTASDIDALRTQGAPSPADGRAQVTAELLGEDGLTKDHAAFDGRTLRIGGFQRAAGLLTVADCERTVANLVATGDLVPLGDDMWTTKEILDLEKSVRGWREERRHLSPPPRPSRPDMWSAIRAQQAERGVTLSGEQLNALIAVLRDRFAAVTGEAGSGKGAVLAAAASVWHRQERRVFAVAIAGATAQRLAADLGNGAQAMTLDGLVTRLRHGRLALREDDVIAIDEAGMIDTRRWAAFASVVKDRATVVAVGDSSQLSPLSAGGLWSLLADGGPHLHEVHRTTLQWERDAWQQLRRGHARGALAAYATHGRIRVSGTRSEALQAAVEAWDKDGRGGLIVTDASNAERDEANRQAQHRKWAAGELGADAVTIAPTSPRFHAGDRVIFRRQWRIGGGVARVENGTTGTVVDVDTARRPSTCAPMNRGRACSRWSPKKGGRCSSSPTRRMCTKRRVRPLTAATLLRAAGRRTGKRSTSRARDRGQERCCLRTGNRWNG